MDDGFRFVAKQWLAVMDESAHRSGPDESLMIALHRVLASPSPPAAEPAIVARVEGAVASWWPRGDGAEVKIGGRGWFPAWPGAVKGQRVEVLVRALDGLEVPAPPASAAINVRTLTDEEMRTVARECREAGEAMRRHTAPMERITAADLAVRVGGPGCCRPEVASEAPRVTPAPEHGRCLKCGGAGYLEFPDGGDEECSECDGAGAHAFKVVASAAPRPLTEAEQDAIDDWHAAPRTPTLKPEETPTCTDPRCAFHGSGTMREGSRCPSWPTPGEGST